MKKLALTSLLAMFAVSGAQAANDVMNGNVLYRPAAGHFYSITDLGTGTKSSNVMTLKEEFGYGITDRLSIAVGAQASEGNWFKSSENAIENAGIKASLRVLNASNWKADVFGQYGVEGIRYPDMVAFDKDATYYGWTIGARAGYETVDYAIAGKIAYTYSNTESFNWDEKGWTDLTAGIEAWWKASDFWSLVAGAEYNKSMGHDSEDGVWAAKFGANLNLDTSKYIGAYITKEMVKGEESGEWDIVDGFGFGLTFGIDF